MPSRAVILTWYIPASHDSSILFQVKNGVGGLRGQMRDGNDLGKGAQQGTLELEAFKLCAGSNASLVFSHVIASLFVLCLPRPELKSAKNSE